MFPRHILEFIISGGPASLRTGNASSAREETPSPSSTTQSLPPERALAAAQAGLASSREDVTVLVMDVVDFIRMSKEVPAEVAMGYISELHTLLDDISEQFGVYKVGEFHSPVSV